MGNSIGQYIHDPKTSIKEPIRDLGCFSVYETAWRSRLSDDPKRCVFEGDIYRASRGSVPDIYMGEAARWTIGEKSAVCVRRADMELFDANENELGTLYRDTEPRRSHLVLSPECLEAVRYGNARYIMMLIGTPTLHTWVLCTWRNDEESQGRDHDARIDTVYLMHSSEELRRRMSGYLADGPVIASPHVRLPLVDAPGCVKLHPAVPGYARCMGEDHGLEWPMELLKTQANKNLTMSDIEHKAELRFGTLPAVSD